MSYYHGGVRDLSVGDLLVPSPPHVDDGCPICAAKASGRTPTVGLMRTFLLARSNEPMAARALKMLEGAPNDAPIDPPSERKAVYFTTDLGYATWYAARSGNGDLYRVEPIGRFERSDADNFPTWTAASARVVDVLRRRVRLDRRERRELERRWKRADRGLE